MEDILFDDETIVIVHKNGCTIPIVKGRLLTGGIQELHFSVVPEEKIKGKHYKATLEIETDADGLEIIDDKQAIVDLLVAALKE